MLTVAIPKRNKLQNIIVLTPKDGGKSRIFTHRDPSAKAEKYKIQLNLVFSGDMTHKMSENVQKTDKIIR